MLSGEVNEFDSSGKLKALPKTISGGFDKNISIKKWSLNFLFPIRPLAKLLYDGEIYFPSVFLQSFGYFFLRS
jgi:hypothetical protein